MDTTTLLIIIVVVLVIAFIANRNRGMYGGNSYPRNMNSGPERPTYDDPDYTSAGSIGGTEVDQPAPQPRERSVGDSGGRSYDDPNYRSGGSIGGG
jgi:hypothetical protein